MIYVDKLSLNIPDTTKPRVVIIGGGFGGMNLVKNLSEKNYQVVLLRPAKLQWLLAAALPGCHRGFGAELRG